MKEVYLEYLLTWIRSILSGGNVAMILNLSKSLVPCHFSWPLLGLCFRTPLDQFEQSKDGGNIFHCILIYWKALIHDGIYRTKYIISCSGLTITNCNCLKSQKYVVFLGFTLSNLDFPATKLITEERCGIPSAAPHWNVDNICVTV